MGYWLERLEGFRLIEPEFDGNAVLTRYFKIGGHHFQLEPDIEKIRRNYSDFPSEEEAIKFLMGEDPD